MAAGHWLSRLLHRVGLHVQGHFPPGHFRRPIGRIDWFLEDIRSRGFDCRRVLDIGASDGSWSRQLLHVYPKASGMLVEPRRECIPSLERFCVENPSWSFLTAAVGAREEKQRLALWDTASTLRKESVSLAAKSITVQVVQCDSLVEPASPYPDIVKLDVEGFELEALSGAARLFGNVDLFIVETATFPFGTMRPLVHDVIAFLANHGYFLYDVAGVIRRPYDGALGLLDLVFARHGSGLTSKPNEWHANQL